MTTIRLFSVFSGIDTSVLALRRLGLPVELVGWAESDPAMIIAHDAIFPEYKERNHYSVSSTDWSQVPDFDVFVMCSPSNDFSIAGNNRGGIEQSGTRSSAMWECRMAVIAKRPKYIIFENVKNILSDEHRCEFFKWAHELDCYGYNNFYQVIDASDCGLPQHRERVIMVSILRGNDNPKYHFPLPRGLRVSLEDVLDREETIPESMKKKVVERPKETKSRQLMLDL